MMTVVICMAGSGVRFQEAGYTEPKPAIVVGGKTLFEWSLSSLSNFFDCRFVFVCREEHKLREFVSEHASALGCKRFAITELVRTTAGQAETVLAAAAEIEPDSPVMIYNIDTFVNPEFLSNSLIRGDGWLPCFVAEGHHWSFVRFDENEKVNSVVEKIRISEFATIGLYYFRSFSLFTEAYARTDYGSYRERFVAPIYDELVRDRKEVFTSVLPATAVHVLGTPQEVEKFERQLEGPEGPAGI